MIINGYDKHQMAFKASIGDRVRAVVARQRWGIPATSSLADSERLGIDLGMDPVGAIELALDLEDVFDIDLEGDVNRVATIGALIELVTERMGVRAGRKPQ